MGCIFAVLVNLDVLSVILVCVSIRLTRHGELYIHVFNCLYVHLVNFSLSLSTMAE